MENCIVKSVRRIKAKDKYVYNLKVDKNRNYFVNGILVHNSPNIVEDESALIPDPFQTMILRMLGGHKVNTLIKVGNPFYRNHFFQSANSTRYKQVFIDYKQALKEGRYTEEFIQEAKENMTPQEFSVLYDSKFPDDSEIDQTGYYRLLTDQQIFGSQKEGKHEGKLRLGFDVGEGGDENAGVLRSDTYVEIVHLSQIKDLMATVRVIDDLINKYKIEPENVFVDRMGIGAGVVARLREIGRNVTGVGWGEKPSQEGYQNLKAENFYRLAESMRGGLNLKPNDLWKELITIKWKQDTSGKVKIKGKDELRKEGIKSPNVADALAMTYNKSIDEVAPQIWTL